MAVSNKKKYAMLMDLMSNDGNEQKRGAMNLLEDNKIDQDIETKSTLLPDIHILPNMIDSGATELETG